MDTKKSLRARIDHHQAELAVQRTVTFNLARENEILKEQIVQLVDELNLQGRETRDRALSLALSHRFEDSLTTAKSFEAYLSGAPEETFDEGTLVKVYDSLSRSFPGLSDSVIRDVVQEMQNAGILFRERGND